MSTIATDARALQAHLVESVGGLVDSIRQTAAPGISDLELFQCLNDASVPLAGEDPNRIFDRAAAWLGAEGWPVSHVSFDDPGLRGQTRPDFHDVQISAELDPASAAAVILHEAAHIQLRHGEIPPFLWEAFYEPIGEVEAESVAYLVAGMHGLDTSGLSVGYIGSWAKGGRVNIRQTAASAISAATEISRAISAVQLPGDAVHLVES